jgi:hypothetical protein
LFRSLFLLLWAHMVGAGALVAKRRVQTDLSGGFCRNYKFAGTDSNPNILY